MTVTLPEVVEVDQSRRIGGGLLDVALPAPDGWERGLAIPFYGCGAPEVSDGCVAFEDEPAQTAVATFAPFQIRQGSRCSTLSRLNQADFAQQRLDASSEYALGQQLSENSAGLADTPTLADALVLGTVADSDFVTAVGCLEQAAADAGFGSDWFLHGPPRAAAYLKDASLLSGDRMSPAGMPWVISSGYQPQAATTVRLWATGPVWVGLSEAQILDDPDWRRNSDIAWALRTGIAVFDPCINVAIDVTVPACPVVGS
jgi:hypothetical protein